MVRSLEEWKPQLRDRYAAYQAGIANGTIQPSHGDGKKKHRRMNRSSDETNAQSSTNEDTSQTVIPLIRVEEPAEPSGDELYSREIPSPSMPSFSRTDPVTREKSLSPPPRKAAESGTDSDTDAGVTMRARNPSASFAASELSTAGSSVLVPVSHRRSPSLPVPRLQFPDAGSADGGPPLASGHRRRATSTTHKVRFDDGDKSSQLDAAAEDATRVRSLSDSAIQALPSDAPHAVNIGRPESCNLPLNSREAALLGDLMHNVSIVCSTSSKDLAHSLIHAAAPLELFRLPRRVRHGAQDASGS